jgi:selenocysteine-specific elongation factor
MTKRLVVGTAGHIDHGKTSLVKALTGIDTDRLKEEKARGITIELGFAHLTLPDGQRLAFVDVPGHERFVRTMIAGASGIDVVLLVIAADEGVMPQTREHLDILELLGVRHGAVVLTKIDLVDEELRELAIDDVQGFVKGTFLEGASILPCSSVTGQGLPALLETLQAFGHQLEERSAAGPFRLPVDRVFSLKGFGTVVTGTVHAGAVSAGDTLEVLPSGLKARVRGVQVHGGEVMKAFAGQRAAINLQGIEKDRIDRGDQLATPGQLLSSSILDVQYHHLGGAAKPLEHRDRVRFLSGTSEVNGVAHVLSGVAIEPGRDGYLQLRLDAPVPARAGDRYVLRLESPVTTLGGGMVLDPAPSKHRRRHRAEAAALLEALHAGTGADEVRTWLVLSGPKGTTVDRLARRSGRPVETLRDALAGAVERGDAVALDVEGREYVAASAMRACREAVIDRLEELHRSNPLKAGAARAEIRVGCPFYGDRVFLRALEDLVAEGEIVAEGPVYRLARFSVALDPADAALAERVTRALEAAGLAVPLLTELKESLGVPEAKLVDLLNYLTSSGVLKKIREGHWATAAAVDALQEALVAHMRAHGELSPVAFKELTGLSRKWAIPMLEYFDKIQLTLRVGDVRRLRGG